MKRFIRLILLLVVGQLAVAGCGQQTELDTIAFDALARWLPSDTENAFFLDLKPESAAGRNWQRIRRQMEKHPETRDALNSLLQEFEVVDFGLEEFIAGPAVSGFNSRANYRILQLSDADGAEDALQRHFGDVEWVQEEHEGDIIYQGRIPVSGQQREWLTWTIHDDFLLLTSGATPTHFGENTESALQMLLSLKGEDSLSAVPSWQELRNRLPQDPMGLIYLNVAEQTRRSPPPSDDTSLGAALARNVEGVILAAVPEQEGMRIQIVGSLSSEAGSAPELRSLFELPAVEPDAWRALPANAALALIAHDASVMWPLLMEVFSVNTAALGQLREAIGLDLESDLMSAGGPLTGDLGLAVLPPLPGQPIIESITAAQVLILASGATEDQVEAVRTAMENRGAVFGPEEVEGVSLQTQVGTTLSGYAISYGFGGSRLFLGTSPEIIGQGLVAQREGRGLVRSDAFQQVSKSLGDEPALVAYLNSEGMNDIARANMPDEEYQNSGEFGLFAPFEALGLGLRIDEDAMDGVLYLLLR